ncbi:MAG TPA: hypothetical protein VJI71_03345 [Candidatus Norongarragalinales archaeon]|nr:hypothetical protein [Candidatus Norongarragalinales archaeon]
MSPKREAHEKFAERVSSELGKHHPDGGIPDLAKNFILRRKLAQAPVLVKELSGHLKKLDDEIRGKQQELESKIDFDLSHAVKGREIPEGSFKKQFELRDERIARENERRNFGLLLDAVSKHVVPKFSRSGKSR